MYSGELRHYRWLVRQRNMKGSRPAPQGVPPQEQGMSATLCTFGLKGLCMNNIPPELAPCGVFCGACPSFSKTCLGCASQRKEQKRTSKWSCKIRKCCYEMKQLSFCGACSEFPCTKVNKKLIQSHPGDTRFRYRHETPENFAKLAELGVVDYLEYQQKRWTCPACGGKVYLYHYVCSNCGQVVEV